MAWLMGIRISNSLGPLLIGIVLVGLHFDESPPNTSPGGIHPPLWAGVAMLGLAALIVVAETTLARCLADLRVSQRNR